MGGNEGGVWILDFSWDEGIEFVEFETAGGANNSILTYKFSVVVELDPGLYSLVLVFHTKVHDLGFKFGVL